MNNVLFTGISAVDGQTLSTLTAVDGQTISAFTPASISGLDWWLYADTISGSDGDPVSSWTDQSGGGNNYSQSTAGSKPTLQTNEYNGHSAVRFATDDKMTGAFTFPATTNTLVAVATPTSSGTSYLFGCNTSNGNPAFISGFNPGTGVKAFEYFNTNSERATFAASASGLHILIVTRTDDSGNAVGYFDGGSAVFSVAVSTVEDWRNHLITELGANASATGDNFFNGDIVELIHYPSIVSKANLNLLGAYLGTRYNITWTTIP